MEDRPKVATEAIDEGKLAEIETPRGRVHVRSYCPSALIQTMAMDEGIGIFPHYRSIVRGKDTLTNLASRSDRNVVLAFTDDNVIVGYIVLTDPDPLARWGQGETEGLVEFAALEVSRNWRRAGIARALMNVAFDDESLDDKIVISTEYSWHWDLEGCELSKSQYRNRLLKLLKAYGFQLFPTNEPNILLDPSNMLTARIGPKAPNFVYLRFHGKLFGTDAPWARAIE